MSNLFKGHDFYAPNFSEKPESRKILAAGLAALALLALMIPNKQLIAETEKENEDHPGGTGGREPVKFVQKKDEPETEEKRRGRRVKPKTKPAFRDSEAAKYLPLSKGFTSATRIPESEPDPETNGKPVFAQVS